MSPIICPCRSYRYSLTHAGKYKFSKWEAVLFIVLKLSAANATLDDLTIRCHRTFVGKVSVTMDLGASISTRRNDSGSVAAVAAAL
jgi:hypothetical protein